MSKYIFFSLLLLSTILQAQTVVPFLQKNGKYILVDATTIKPIANAKEYDKADELEGGFWQLCMDGYCALYNKFGKEIIKPRDYEIQKKLYNNVFITLKGQIFASKEGFGTFAFDGLFGLIDTMGVELIPTKYRHIDRFSEDLAAFRKNISEYGYIDKTGKEVIKGLLGDAAQFSDGLARIEVNYTNADNYVYYIDKSGNTILKPSMTTKTRFGRFHEGLAFYKQKGNSLWGYINKAGKITIPAKFQEVFDFVDGLALVEYKYTFGFIDKTGEFAIANEYDEAKSFNNGLAIVKKGIRFGAINNFGEETIPIEYDGIFDLGDSVFVAVNQGIYYYYNSANGKIFFSTKDINNSTLKDFEYGHTFIIAPYETYLLDKTGKKNKLPKDANKGNYWKTPNYVQVRYSDGSLFKNYFMSLTGIVYKEK